MTSVIENNVVQRRRGSRSQLFRPVSDRDMLHDNSIISEHNWFWNKIGGVFSLLGNDTTMNKSAKTALIAIAILVCVIAVILLLSLRSSDACIKLGEAEETCYAKQSNSYRLYGTKTAYHVVSGNLSSTPNVEGCTPKVFYLFSRHATRYPDKEDIEEMIKLLPDLQNRMLNNSHMVKMCKEDLQNLKNWVEKMKPEDDNKMSSTGEAETILLAQHFKSHFPTILGEKYSPEKFKFEFTSRERTRSTAESFAQGLFGDKFKEINFDDSINDMLQFHKECKEMQKRCKYQGYDTSEIDKFVKGTWMQKVTESVSSRIDIPLSYDDLKTIYKACVFGYALNTGDVWCSLFTPDELKVIEFGEDIDDYYKDAYGNKINYEQACPVVEDTIDLFKTYTNTSKSKVLLQFSHAGGIKKVYSIFGLFKDEDPLRADGICSQENRKWRSSIIAPFTSNLALILYECGADLKIAAFLNEKPVKLGGCSDLLCSYEEFLEVYNPIAEECDLKKICCTCCRD